MLSDRAFDGRLTDGKTAGAKSVQVRFSTRGLELTTPGEKTDLTWPYGALGTVSPLTSSAADVVVTYDHMPGATLFVSDPLFADALAKAAPQLTAGAQRWRFARPLLAVTVAAFAIGFAIWALDLSPVRAVANVMPDRLRDSLGRQVVGSMSQNRRTCTTSEGGAALDALVSRLSAATGTQTKFKVTVINWNLLNAFAAPGEQIVLTREMITRAQTPDELAGVLAHEMGHGLERHPESAIIRAIGLSAAVELFFTGSGGTLTNIGLMLTQLSYTRAAEREADQHALRILQAAQISPKGIADFFGRLEGGTAKGKDKDAQGPRGFDLLRSHPQSGERAALAAKQPAYPATPALDAAQWQALRAICG